MVKGEKKMGQSLY